MSFQSHTIYYSTELELNERFRIFAVNCSLLYGGHNTVAAQLKYTYKQKRSKQASQKGNCRMFFERTKIH